MMIIRSQWGVKVALSVVFFFTIHGVVAQSVADDFFLTKVTLKGNAIAFEDVLKQLSSQTKLFFIYSSNAIGLKTPVSIEASRRPLHEVLQQLSDVMQITFRKEGSYVVVKPMKPTTFVRQARLSSPLKRTDNLPVESLERDNPTAFKAFSTSIGRPLSIPAELLAENLLSCRSQFATIDTSFVKKYFPLKITNPNARHVLFSSLGLIANEYWVGAELHVGMPWMYTVLNTGRLRGGYFRHGIGLGSAIPIKPRVTLNPIYTFATMKQRQDYLIDPDMHLVIKDGLKAVGRHHQFKLVFEIKLTSKLMAHFGPSLNFLKTNYTVETGEMILTENLKYSVPGYNGANQVTVERIVQYQHAAPATYSVVKSWCGFEAGVSYSLKFPRR